MAFSTRGSALCLFGLAALVAACGGSVESVDVGVDGAGGAGSTSAGGPEGDPDPPPQPPGTPPSAAPAGWEGCGLDGASAEGLLAVVVGAELHVLQRDGAWRVAHRFGQGVVAADEDVLVDVVTARDGWLAATAFLYDPEVGSGYETVLLGPDGGLRWSVRVTSGTSPNMFLGHTGWLALDWGGGGTVTSPDGVARPVAAAPIAAPDDAGDVPVRVGVGASAAFGWLAPDDAFVPLVMPRSPADVANGTPPQWIGDRLVYQSDAAHGAVFVGERPGAAPLVLAPAVSSGAAVLEWAPSYDAGLAVVDAYPPTADAFVADFARGALTRYALVPPGVAEPTDPELRIVPTLGDDGAFLVGFQVAGKAQLFRSADLGASWQTVGEAAVGTGKIGGGELGTSVSGEARRGTVMVVHADQDPYATFYGPSQLVRPADGISVDLQPHGGALPPVLRPNGECAATPSADGERLLLVDAWTGERRALQVTGAPIWIR